MYGDFSRLTFNRAKQFSGLWMQQGRDVLDSDLNEQTAIVLDWLRTFAEDFIGPYGGHLGKAGFKVTYVKAEDDLRLSPGHYYVHGLRCAAQRGHADDGTVRDVTWRSHQPHLAGGSAIPDHPFLVCLVAWERSVSARSDHQLLEPALGPLAPDTCVRSRVDWTLALGFEHLIKRTNGKLDKDLTSEAVNETLNLNRKVPYLTAKTRRRPDALGADSADNDLGYSGVENQLYRVEIHRGGTAGGRDGATFKWSRVNASIEFEITGLDSVATPSSGTLTTVRVDQSAGNQPAVHLTTWGTAGRPQLEPGSCVELVDDNWAPIGDPGPLLEVVSADRSAGTVVLHGDVNTDLRLHPFLRLWDNPFSGQDGAAIEEGNRRTELEDDIYVQFSDVGARYERGDYWLIVARTARRDVLWPRRAGRPLPLPPNGPDRFFAPLAVVESGEAHDLRSLFTHLAWPEP